jgi:hypothetical protein
MSADPTNPNKLAFSSRCLPGSPAEEQEAKRLAEFHRCKALHQAEEERLKPEMDAQRHEKYLITTEAVKQERTRSRAARDASNAQRNFLRP